MRQEIDEIISEKISRIESALGDVSKHFSNVVRTSAELPEMGAQPGAMPASPSTPAPAAGGQPNTGENPTPEESSVIEKVLSKIKDFIGKIQQAPAAGGQEQPGISLATVKTALDDQTKNKYYQNFINWVKTSLKPYLDEKQSSGTALDKGKIVKTLRERIAKELPDWSEFIFKSLSGSPAPATGGNILTSSFLFDDTVLAAKQDVLDPAVIEILNTRYSANPAPEEIMKMLARKTFNSPSFDKHVGDNPAKSSLAHVKVPIDSFKNEVGARYNELAGQSGGKTPQDLYNYGKKNFDRSFEEIANSFFGPMNEHVSHLYNKLLQDTNKNWVTLMQQKPELTQGQKRVPLEVIRNDQDLSKEIILHLTELYGADVTNEQAIGKRAFEAQTLNSAWPQAQQFMDISAVAVGRNIVAKLRSLFAGGQQAQPGAPAPTQAQISRVLNLYYDKFAFLAANLASEYDMDEVVTALTGNAVSDPYHRIVSDYILRKYSDVRLAEDLVEKIQPMVADNPPLFKRFFEDYVDSAQEKVQEFQNSSGISDLIINNVLQDKLLDENGLKELQDLIGKTISQGSEESDPEERGDSGASPEQENKVEQFVDDKEISPEMTAVVVNSEMQEVVQRLFSEVSLEEQAEIAGSEDLMQEIFSYLGGEIRKIDKRYSEGKIMLLFDPTKGFYIKDEGSISPQEENKVQQEVSSPADIPGDQELAFPTGNEFGGDQPAAQDSAPAAAPGAAPAAPATPPATGGAQNTSEFEQALN